MQDTKKIWQSLGVQGGAVAGIGTAGGIAPLLAGALSLMGYDATSADAQEVLAGIEQIVTGIGAVLAIWGRIRAKSEIAIKGG